MLCKIARSRLKPEAVNSFKKIIRDEYVPVITKQKGFRGFSFGIKENNEFTIILYWMESGDMSKWAKSKEHARISKKTVPLFIVDVDQDIYQVEEQEWLI